MGVFSIGRNVLGIATDITITRLLELTNQKRIENGLPELQNNEQLADAARRKAANMFEKNYWAHFAPDGTSPWSFFLKFGYKYRYAGENLARDFSDAGSAVAAWMNSPTHRENILNSNYKEIGIGVVEGSLLGADTTIIVQFFGTPLTGEPSIPVAEAKSEISTPKPVATAAAVSTPVPTPTLVPTPSLSPDVIYKQGSSAASVSLISPFGYTKNITLLVTGILILVLSIDLVVVKRRKLARIGGRTLAHLAYFGMILAVILILRAGQII